MSLEFISPISRYPFYWLPEKLKNHTCGLCYISLGHHKKKLRPRKETQTNRDQENAHHLHNNTRGKPVSGIYEGHRGVVSLAREEMEIRRTGPLFLVEEELHSPKQTLYKRQTLHRKLQSDC